MTQFQFRQSDSSLQGFPILPTIIQNLWKFLLYIQTPKKLNNVGESARFFVIHNLFYFNSSFFLAQVCTLVIYTIHVLHIYTSCDENSSQDIQCPNQDIPLVWANFSTISMPFMCHWCSDIISLSNSLWTIALGWWSTTHSWQVLQPLFW